MRISRALAVRLAVVTALTGGCLALPARAKDKSDDEKKYEKYVEKMSREMEKNAGRTDRPPEPTPKIKSSSSDKALQQIHDQLKPTDQEWEVLVPRVESVYRLVKEVNAGHDSHGIREPKSEHSSDDPTEPTSEVSIRARDLTAALLDPLTSPSNLKDRISALRIAKDNARQRLVAAQSELRDLLTVRQEATLIIMGLLD